MGGAQEAPLLHRKDVAVATRLTESKPTLTASTRPRRKFSRRRFNQRLTGHLFALPWLIGFAVFTLWPMLYSLYTSFTRYNIIGEPRWLGLRNYQNILFNDSMFLKALENTFWMVIVKTPIVIVAALT